jgi:hypothetical protein
MLRSRSQKCCDLPTRASFQLLKIKWSIFLIKRTGERQVLLNKLLFSLKKRLQFCVKTRRFVDVEFLVHFSLAAKIGAIKH